MSSLTLRLVAYGSIVVIVIAGYLGWSHHERTVGAAPYVAQLKILNDNLTKQKADATTLLTSETKRANEAETQLKAAKDNQEKEDAQAKTVVDGLTRRLASLVDATGRLRDPHAAGRRGSGGSASSQTPASTGGGAANPPEAGGLLSADLSELLQRLTKEADDINTAYISCRADSLSLRATLGGRP